MYVYSFVVAMFVTMALMPLLIRASTRFGMLDHPEPRKVHTEVVPRTGGLAMLAGLLVSLAAFESFSASVVGILVGVLIVVAEGAWDDARSLHYLQKFSAQILAAACVVLIGGLEIRELTLHQEILLPRWASVPLSMFVIVALTNAINLADGLDGLAGGISFLCCAALAVLAYLSSNLSALIMATALCGAIIGFLRFNTHPAVVFMGDGGSQLLGLAIASLAIFVTQSETSVVGATLPLYLLAVPIVDTIYVMVQRVRRGRSPFAPDKNHMHHRLLALGLNQRQAVGLIYLVQGLLFLMAYLMRFESDATNLIVFALVGGLLIALTAGGWFSVLGCIRPQIRVHHWRQVHPSVRPLATGFLQLSLIAYCLLGVATLEVSIDLAIGLVLASILILCLMLVPGGLVDRTSVIEKCILYMLATSFAYLFASAGEVSSDLRRLETLIIAVIAVLTALVLRYSRENPFELNTLDLLVLFTAIVIPNLPGTDWQGANLASMATRMVVLFYALAVVINSKSWNTPVSRRFALFLCVGAISLKAFV